MNSINRISQTLITCDNWADKLPLVSSVTNLINLFLKCLSNCFPNQNFNKNHYFEYLKTKSFSDCLILLLPGIGNIYFYYHHKQKNKVETPSKEKENIEIKNTELSENKPKLNELNKDGSKQPNPPVNQPKEKIKDKKDQLHSPHVSSNLSEDEVSKMQFSLIDPQDRKNRLFLEGRALELNSNFKDAIDKYKQAAQQNHPLAMFYLAKCYSSQSNMAEAFKWFQEAAKHQHFESLLILIDRAFKDKNRDASFELCHKIGKCLTEQALIKQTKLLELIEKNNQLRFKIEFNFLLGEEEGSRKATEQIRLDPFSINLGKIPITP